MQLTVAIIWTGLILIAPHNFWLAERKVLTHKQRRCKCSPYAHKCMEYDVIHIVRSCAPSYITKCCAEGDIWAKSDGVDENRVILHEEMVTIVHTCLPISSIMFLTSCSETGSCKILWILDNLTQGPNPMNS